MKKLFLGLSILFLLAGCKKDENTSRFAGTWKGTYIGSNDNGYFQFTVDDGGNVNASSLSSPTSTVLTGKGNATSSGNLTVALGIATSGATFTGTISDTTATGSWENKSTGTSYTGTWKTSKQ